MPHQSPEISSTSSPGKPVRADQLVAGIAHDVNNMLAIVMGNLELARSGLEDVDDPRAVGCLRRAALGARKAAALVAELIEAGRSPENPPVNANDVIEELVGLLSRSLDPNIRVSVRLAPDVRGLAVDGAELESALLNLCLNARDAMPAGGTLVIETVGVATKPFLRISVSDTGTGMPPEVLSRALEAFFTTKKDKGTGLGLARVSAFTRDSGGTVEIQSEVGVGTVVRLYLPQVD